MIHLSFIKALLDNVLFFELRDLSVFLCDHFLTLLLPGVFVCIFRHRVMDSQSDPPGQNATRELLEVNPIRSFPTCLLLNKRPAELDPEARSAEFKKFKKSGK